MVCGLCSNSVRRHGQLITGVGALALLALPLASALLGAPDNLVEVTFRCEALKGRSGVPLRVLHETPMGVAVVPSIVATFSDNGECRLDLPAGVYVFEAGEILSDAIVALRTPARRIAHGAVVEFKAAEPQQLTLKYRDEQTLPVQEIAIRSAAATGEITWTGDSAEPPRLLLSPGQQYMTRVLGGNDETRFAIWQTVTSTRPIIQLEADAVYRCKFQVHQDGPQIRNAAVRFQFPDGDMRFPVSSETTFLTNRRFLSFGYGLELANGRRIGLRPWLGLVKKGQVFELGGPLVPSAWAKVMIRKPVGGPQTHHLVWDANLYDPRGHMVLTDESQIDWKDAVRTASGAAVPQGRPLSKADLAAFVANGDSLAIDVAYHLEEPFKTTLRPDRFRPFGNRRFHTTAPPHWELQAINYLARAERVFHMIEDLEGKPSKHRVEVRWHNMNGAAWGCGPAGGNAHIIMPFSGLKKSFNYYDTPWALAHEMLHTFGYGHDERMNRMSSLVEKRFEQYRWYMADRPQQDPETAFVGFRVATQIPVGRLSMPAKGKKKGTKK